MTRKISWESLRHLCSGNIWSWPLRCFPWIYMSSSRWTTSKVFQKALCADLRSKSLSHCTIWKNITSYIVTWNQRIFFLGRAIRVVSKSLTLVVEHMRMSNSTPIFRVVSTELLRSWWESATLQQLICGHWAAFCMNCLLGSQSSLVKTRKSKCSVSWRLKVSLPDQW